MLRDRVNVHGYEGCQDDILAVSGMAEDIRDALLEYQVGSEQFYTSVMLLRLGLFDRQSSNGRYMTRIAS